MRFVSLTLCLAAAVLASGEDDPSSRPTEPFPAVAVVKVGAAAHGQPCAILLLNAMPKDAPAIDKPMVLPAPSNPGRFAIRQVSPPAPPCDEAELRDGPAPSIADQIVSLALKGWDLFTMLRTTPGDQLQMAASGPVGAGKLDPSLVALVQIVRSAARPGGETKVRITLTNAPADSLAQLRKAGVTITHQQRNDVTGRIAVEKLEAVTQLPFVVWIATR